MKCGILLLLLLPFTMFAQSADELVQQAGDLFGAGKLAEATRLMEDGVAHNPGTARLYGVLARLYLEGGNMNKAYAVAAKGLTIDNTDGNLGMTFARAALALGKADEALSRTTADIARDPNTFGRYLVQGDALAMLGRNNEAVTSYNKAIALNAAYGPAFRRRAAAQRVLKNYNAAITDYNEAIRLTPADAEALNGRGMTYFFKGDAAAAIADYSAAFALRPRWADVFNNRGAAYASLYDSAKAAADYTAAISLDPQFADPHFQLALLHSDGANLAKASSEISAALALDGNNALFETLHSKILLREGKTEEGLAAAKKALTLDPSNTDALFYQALALNNSDRYDEASQALQKAIDKAPSDYLLQAFNAYLNRQAGNRTAADAADEKAAQLARAAGATYTPMLSRNQGCISGNCVNGNGVYVYPSGNKYSGSFRNRKLDGRGTFSFANGEKFDGVFSSNQKQEGTYSFNNGATYSGTYNSDGREWNGHYAFNQIDIPVVNGVAKVPSNPPPMPAAKTSNATTRTTTSNAPMTMMCTACYGSGKIHKTVYGGQYEYDKYGNRSVSFGSYETCFTCMGRGTVPLR